MLFVLLESLTILNYRNLAQATLDFPAGMSAIWGPNGAGKTNLQEAIYLALTGLSDAPRLEQLVTQGHTEAYVRAQVRQGGSLSVLEVGLGRGRKNLKADGVRVKVGELPRASAVWIRPEDSQLVYGSPATRRRYLDELLARLSPRYGEQQLRYERALAQRNAALKSGEYWAMSVWEEALANLGSEIMLLRRRAVGRLRELAQRSNAALGSRKVLTIELQESTTPETYRQDFARVSAEERARGMTVIGPHRDDLRLSLGTLGAGDYASRGEARTVALSLRHAEVTLLFERYREQPVLLIDDFSAELDPSRRQFLLEMASGAPQAIVTGTDPVPGAVASWQASAGTFGQQDGQLQVGQLEVGQPAAPATTPPATPPASQPVADRQVTEA